MKILLTTTTLIMLAFNATAAAPERDAPLQGALAKDMIAFYKATPEIKNVDKRVMTYDELYVLNKEVNYSIQYQDEPAGESRYQSAEETLKLKTGDCEDLAILKWDEMRRRGVPESDMEFVWGTNAKGQFHLTLWYWNGEETYYLDSAADDIHVNGLTGDLYKAYNRNGVRTYMKHNDLDSDGLINSSERDKARAKEEHFRELLKVKEQQKVSDN